MRLGQFKQSLEDQYSFFKSAVEDDLCLVEAHGDQKRLDGVLLAHFNAQRFGVDDINPLIAINPDSFESIQNKLSKDLDEFNNDFLHAHKFLALMQCLDRLFSLGIEVDLPDDAIRNNDSRFIIDRIFQDSNSKTRLERAIGTSSQKNYIVDLLRDKFLAQIKQNCFPENITGYEECFNIAAQIFKQEEKTEELFQDRSYQEPYETILEAINQLDKFDDADDVEKVIERSGINKSDFQVFDDGEAAVFISKKDGTALKYYWDKGQADKTMELAALATAQQNHISGVPRILDNDLRMIIMTKSQGETLEALNPQKFYNDNFVKHLDDLFARVAKLSKLGIYCDLGNSANLLYDQQNGFEIIDIAIDWVDPDAVLTALKNSLVKKVPEKEREIEAAYSKVA